MVHEIIQAQCPNCSPHEPVPHDILKEKPDILIKCTLCGTIHPYYSEKKKKTNIRVVISAGDSSTTSTIVQESDEIISVDDEFIVESGPEGEANFVLVTSIESGDKRVHSARADEIDTIWTRHTDTVTTKISITRGWQTESIEMEVPGEREFTIGEMLSSGPDRFVIKKIKVRDGKFFKRNGECVMAKYIKRIFADSSERMEWLRDYKKTGKKRPGKPYSGGPLIKPRGPSTWTLKRKEGN